MEPNIVHLAGDQLLDLKKDCCISLEFAFNQIHMLDVSLNRCFANIFGQHLAILEKSHNLGVLETDSLLLCFVFSNVSERFIHLSLLVFNVLVRKRFLHGQNSLQNIDSSDGIFEREVVL